MPVANGVPGEEQAIMKLSEGSSGGKNLGKGATNRAGGGSSGRRPCKIPDRSRSVRRTGGRPGRFPSQDPRSSIREPRTARRGTASPGGRWWPLPGTGSRQEGPEALDVLLGDDGGMGLRDEDQVRYDHLGRFLGEDHVAGGEKERSQGGMRVKKSIDDEKKVLDDGLMTRRGGRGHEELSVDQFVATGSPSGSDMNSS